MMEEFTSKMHSEFQVSTKSAIKHKAFAVLDLIDSGITKYQALKYSGVTLDDLKRHLQEYNRLTLKKIVLK